MFERLQEDFQKKMKKGVDSVLKNTMQQGTLAKDVKKALEALTLQVLSLFTVNTLFTVSLSNTL